MKRLIGLSLMAAVLAPATVSAETTRGELRRDRQDVREERRELRDAQRYGDRRDVREERGEYRDARREYRQDLQDWRQDRRANHNRGYRRGHWNAPFRYNAFTPGYRIQPRYYGQRYYIANPNRYGLTGAYGSQRWVRHYDDALLIDIRSGTVRRVIRGFYW